MKRPASTWRKSAIGDKLFEGQVLRLARSSTDTGYERDWSRRNGDHMRRRFAWWLGPFLLAISVGTGAGAAQDKTAVVRTSGPPGEGIAIRHNTGGGKWYPADSAVLQQAVDGYLSGATSVVARRPAALIAPHAGYQYAGAVAGAAYATLLGRSYKRVIVLGVSHQAYLRGASVLHVDAYETPLGRIPVDVAVRDALLRSPLVTEQAAAHELEHSIENQLPFLQRAIGDFALVAVLVGEMTEAERADLAKLLRRFSDSETLLVASSDFTHHGAAYGYTIFTDSLPERLRMLNDAAIQHILRLDPIGWDAFLRATGATICGRNAVGLLLAVLEPRTDLVASRLAYDTSGRLTGDWSISVTYDAIAFWQPDDELTAAERKLLLRLARNTLKSALDSNAEFIDGEYEMTPDLMTPGAAFVTLNHGRVLRGCVGHVAAVEPLYMSVARNAYWAAMDPRFARNPVTVDELKDLSIEISVLSALRRLPDPRDVMLGRDGLMVVRGQHQGVLLPTVPVREGWDKEQFLAAACVKAGLPPDAWKDPHTDIFRFSARVFGEEEPGR